MAYITHPKLDNKGNAFLIKNPNQPTTLETWGNSSQIASVIPGSAMPDVLCNIAFRTWIDAPFDSVSWERLAEASSFDEPPFEASAGKNAASGAVVLETDGRVWVVSPSNQFGGYTNTFPKGKIDPSEKLSLRANALKEVYEEAGLRVELTDFLCDSERDTSTTRYYLARRIGGNPTDMGWESQTVHLVPRSQLAKVVSHKNDAQVLSVLDEKVSLQREYQFIREVMAPISVEYTGRDNNVATKNSWENLRPLPNRHTIIFLDFRLNAKQAKRIQQGFIPAVMEEKWFAYYENNTLFQHRSWTGFCIDQVHFEAAGDSLRAIHAEVNRDPTQYLCRDDNEDRSRITEMVMALADLLPGAKSQSVDSMVAAFAKLAQPNYLGSPDVMNQLISEYYNACIYFWNIGSGDLSGTCLSPEEKRMADKKLCKILTGKNSEYLTIGGWHSKNEMGQAIVKYFHLDAEECANESLGFILREALDSISGMIEDLLDMTFSFVGIIEEYQNDEDILATISPTLNEFQQFVVAVLMGTNTVLMPGKTIDAFKPSNLITTENNLAYILLLLMTLIKLPPEERTKRQKEIVDILAGEMQLRSKKLLIQTFIDENLPNIKPTDNIIAEFESFWADNKLKAFSALCEEESIVPEQLEKLLNNYTFANRLPSGQEIVSALSFKPKILQRESIIERVTDKIKAFIDTFIEGMGGSV